MRRVRVESAFCADVASVQAGSRAVYDFEVNVSGYFVWLLNGFIVAAAGLFMVVGLSVVGGH